MVACQILVVPSIVQVIRHTNVRGVNMIYYDVRTVVIDLYVQHCASGFSKM